MCGRKLSCCGKSESGLSWLADISSQGAGSAGRLLIAKPVSCRSAAAADSRKLGEQPSLRLR